MHPRAEIGDAQAHLPGQFALEGRVELLDARLLQVERDAVSVRRVAETI